MRSKETIVYLIIQTLLFLAIKVFDYYANNVTYTSVRFLFIVVNAIFATKLFIDASEKIVWNTDLLLLGLWTTVVADFFLVFLPNISPSLDSISTLVGFSFFVIVQTIYAFYLGMPRNNFIIRLIAILSFWALLIVTDKFTISLAIGAINMVMLTINVITAWRRWNQEHSTDKFLFALAITCFLICDYSIVLKAVTINVSHEIFRFLVWAAYAPAQILIVLTYKIKKWKGSSVI